jgi:hypothetical protein
MSFSKFVKKPSFKNAALMSTPMMVTCFIVACMFVVFTMESLGLSNRIKNIELREVSIDKCKEIFLTILAILMKLERIRGDEHNDELVSPQFNTARTFIDKQEIHFKMLYESAVLYTQTDQSEEFFDI